MLNIIDRKINIDGLDIYYQIGGNENKPVILWLDELSVSSKLELRTSKSTKLLTTFFNDFNIIAFEYPSFMRSSLPAIKWNLDNYVEILDKFITRINLKSPFLLMDHSIGAKIWMGNPQKEHRNWYRTKVGFAKRTFGQNFDRHRQKRKSARRTKEEIWTTIKK